MAVWKIPITWEMCGEVKIEANTLEEAMEIAKDDDGFIPLPDGSYVDGSWQLTNTDEGFIRQYYNHNQQDEEE